MKRTLTPPFPSALLASRTFILFIVFPLLCLAPVRAQTLDRKDFVGRQAPGSTVVLQGSGTLNGNATIFKQTSVIQATHATINGVVTTRGDQTLEFAGLNVLSSVYLDDLESLYKSDVSVNGNLIQSLNYSPALSPFPRFFSLGQSSNYSSNISGTSSGANVSGQIAGTITIEGIENVPTGIGTFEAVRARISFSEDLNSSAGSQRVTANRKIWVARGVGMVRFQSNESSSDSAGNQTNANYDITLSSTNFPVTPQPVFVSTGHPAFFNGEAVLSNGVYYLQFAGNGNVFGYYSYLGDPKYIYHFDLGYEYLFDANDGRGGIYFYDFLSNTFFYTSPSYPFPYLYDFSLNAVLYYFPQSNNPSHYTTNPRYFYNTKTGQIISK